MQRLSMTIQITSPGCLCGQSIHPNGDWCVGERPITSSTSIVPLHGLLPDDSGRTCCDLEPKACEAIEELAAAHERRGVTHFILPGGGTCCDTDPKVCEG